MSDEEKVASDAESSSSEDEGPSEPIVTVAIGRSRRANAGSKMAALLEQAEQDDFYQSTYGGFDETAEEEDPDFFAKADEEDIFDSDFDEPEDEPDEAEDGDGADVPREEFEEDEEEAAKKRKKAKQIAAIVKPTKKAPPRPKVFRASSPRAEGSPKSKALQTPVTRVFGSPRVRAKRQSTAVKSAEIHERVIQREKRRRRQMETFMIKQKMLAETCRPMTQHERLQEAKKTEEINLKSLERHERLEEDKKKTVVRKGLKGRFIRLQSTRMPLVEEMGFEHEPPTKPEIIEIEDAAEGTEKKPELRSAENTSEQYHSRTFVTFPDHQSFVEFFPDTDQTEKKLERSLRRILCPITAKPARYRDPVTKVPYHNSFAFRVIREAYAMALERHGSKKNEEVQRWLRWRQQLVKRRREESLRAVQKVIDGKPRIISNGSITATLTVEDDDSGVVA